MSEQRTPEKLKQKARARAHTKFTKRDEDLCSKKIYGLKWITVIDFYGYFAFYSVSECMYLRGPKRAIRFLSVPLTTLHDSTYVCTYPHTICAMNDTYLSTVRCIQSTNL